MRQCWPFVDPWLVVNSCPATPTLRYLRSTAMHSGFHFAGGRSQHRNVLMTSDPGTGTFADYRYPLWVHICGRPSQFSQRPAMDSCPATPTLRYLRTNAMHSGFHFASRRSTHRNVLMTSDFGTVTFADNRYDRRTLTWQCFIMFISRQMHRLPSIETSPSMPHLACR